MLDLVRRFRATPSDVASLRAERKRVSREVAGLERSELLGLAHQMIAAGVARFVAYEMVLHHRATMDGIEPAEVERLGEGMADWADIDSFGCIVSGPAWRMGRIPDEWIQRWARSGGWQWRRAALVSTVPLNAAARGGAGDTKRTLDICRMLTGDRGDLVVKALSWALRELGKRDPLSVRGFLREYEGRLAGRVVREVTNKLDTGLKNPKR